MPTIAALAATVVAFFAAMLLVPAIGALVSGDWPALEAFLLLAIAYGFFAGATIMALASRLRRLSRAGVFTATISMWLALSMAAVPPFILIENQPLAPAIFEAISAAITMGTTFRPLADISPAMMMYRGMVAWQGGLLTLLLAVYVLGRYEVGGTPNRHIRYILHSFDSGAPRIPQTFFEVFVPYLALTLVCAASLVVARTNPADALNLAINIVSTNGFAPIQTGASILNNVAGEIILMIFMVLGATSIIWHRALVGRKWHQAREQTESTMFLFSLVGISLIGVLVVFARPVEHFTQAEAAFNVVFDTISIMTTTGITHDARFGIALPIELILAVAIIGGCSYSTAGGVRFFRLETMLRHSANEIRRLVYPHLMQAHSVEEDPRERRLAKAVWSSLFIAVLTIVVATAMFALLGADLISSLSLAMGALSATGNMVFSAMPHLDGELPTDANLLVLASVGLLARIELLVVLAAFGRSKW